MNNGKEATISNRHIAILLVERSNETYFSQDPTQPNDQCVVYPGSYLTGRNLKFWHICNLQRFVAVTTSCYNLCYNKDLLRLSIYQMTVYEKNK
ncbi:hypothetical protein GJ496_001722 [Pomphorhynchus laevis]|nr:hypothetical protein GJ496_001722 [Pomphorhynchus laevis]